MAVSTGGVFVAGVFLSFESIYSIAFAAVLIFASFASFGYIDALDQIHVFARNEYVRSDPSNTVLLTGKEPVNFIDKFPYDRRPSISALKMYFSILFRSAIVAILMLVVGIIGNVLGRYLVYLT